jgi:hypothetical protein
MMARMPAFDAAVPGPPLEVRPPWPDELPRLIEAFPGLTLDRPCDLRVLVVTAGTGTIDRLVGLAALTGPAAGKTEARLIFAVRLRFAHAEAAGQLLSEILAVGAARGFATVTIPALTAADHRMALLAQAGFQAVSDGSYWSMDTKI